MREFFGSHVDKLPRCCWLYTGFYLSEGAAFLGAILCKITAKLPAINSQLPGPEAYEQARKSVDPLPPPPFEKIPALLPQ